MIWTHLTERCRTYAACAITRTRQNREEAYHTARHQPLSMRFARMGHIRAVKRRTDMKFCEMPYTRPDIDETKKSFDSLTERLASAKSYADAKEA